MTVASMVRAARESRGWSQAEVARRAGVARQAVWRVERGMGGMSRTRLLDMAIVLGLDREAILAADRASRAVRITVDLSVLGDDEPIMQAARELWRQMAGAVPEREATALYAERRELLTKVNAGSATKAEKNRLALVRWHLERIEDAKHGEGLDKLEALGRIYARMADRVRDVVGELERADTARAVDRAARLRADLAAAPGT